MNTVTEVTTRWRLWSVAILLGILNTLQDLSGTKEELKQLHDALDAAFTVKVPSEYVIGYVPTYNQKFYGGNGLRDAKRFTAASEALSWFRSVELEARSYLGRTNFRIVEVQGDTIIRTVETIEPPVKVEYIITAACGSTKNYTFRENGDFRFPAPNGALRFSSVVEARAWFNGNVERVYAVDSFHDFAIQEVKGNTLGSVVETLKRVKNEFVVRYEYKSRPRGVFYAAPHVGFGVYDISKSLVSRFSSVSALETDFKTTEMPGVKSVEIVEVRGNEIVRVVKDITEKFVPKKLEYVVRFTLNPTYIHNEKYFLSLRSYNTGSGNSLLSNARRFATVSDAVMGVSKIEHSPSFETSNIEIVEVQGDTIIRVVVP